MLDRRAAMVGGAGLAAATSIFGLTGCFQNHKLRLIGEDSSNLKAIQALFDGFEQSSGLPVEAELLDFETMGKQADIDLSRQGSGRFDIVCQYNFALTPYVKNNYVLDVAALKKAAPGVDFAFESDILPNIWHELGYYAPANQPVSTARPIAYPFAANTMILVCNRKVLATPKIRSALDQAFGAGFTTPNSWEDLVRAALTISDADPFYKGIVLQGAAGSWLYYEWMNFLFGVGGKVMSKPWGWASDLETPLQLRSPKTAQAAKLYLALKPANAGDFFAVDAVQQRDIMLEGKTAFAIMWTDYIPDLALKNREDFGFVPVPGRLSMIAGGSFFVSRKTSQPANVAALISYLMRPNIQKRLALTGLFPPTRTAMNDPDVLALPYMPAVRESHDRGVYMDEAGPDADVISTKITDVLQAAWKGEFGPEEVGPRAAAAILEARIQLVNG